MTQNTNSVLCANNEMFVYKIAVWEEWSQLFDALGHYHHTTKQASALIYVFEDVGNMPQPLSMPKLREFMVANQAPPHKTIFVNAPRVLKVFFRMGQHVYADICKHEDDYVFVDKLEDVHTLIRPPARR